MNHVKKMVLVPHQHKEPNHGSKDISTQTESSSELPHRDNIEKLTHELPNRDVEKPKSFKIKPPPGRRNDWLSKWIKVYK